MKTLRNINNTFESYQQLIDFYRAHKETRFSDIHLELRQWFAANMSAALGAILDLHQQDINNIHFDYIKPETKSILSKNEFLSYFGYPRITDNYHTTIRFLKLTPADGKYFNSYVHGELLGRNELPIMSQLVKDNIAIGIYEIFVNAQLHSETELIYTCGQFFPTKNKIEFTIVDTGIGFKEKVNRRFNRNLNAAQAIKWATQDKNTTKTDVTGGIGLALLKEFVQKNRGKVQIVSDDGFYQYSTQGEEMKLFNGSFPGTIVNLQFRTDDNSSYVMQAELNANDIF